MKKLFAFMIVLMTFCVASAKSVVFTLSDGTLVYYLLGGDVSPVMKFVDGEIYVNADKYELSGIKNFYISETDDPEIVSIQNVGAPEAKLSANMFTLKSDKAKAVKVFTASGIEVKPQIENAGGLINVNLTDLDRGIYIIYVGEASFKVNKK